MEAKEIKIVYFLCCTRMPARFNKSRTKSTTFFRGKTFYEVSLDEIDPKIKYRTATLFRSESNTKLMLYW